jgi:AcrR family transcriptional regulator
MAPMTLTSGRIRQKKRTRSALIAAAAELVREGQAPSVPDAAERAGISRATAYRYFPSQDALELEAASAILAAEPGAASPIGDIQTFETPASSPDDCVNAVEKLESAVSETFWRDEPQIRLVLKSQLDLWLAMKRERHVTMRRPARAMPGLDAALAPLKARLPSADYEILSGALALVTSSEAIVALLDSSGIRDPDKLSAIRRFAVRAILASAFEKAACPGA